MFRFILCLVTFVLYSQPSWAMNCAQNFWKHIQLVQYSVGERNPVRIREFSERVNSVMDRSISPDTAGRVLAQDLGIVLGLKSKKDTQALGNLVARLDPRTLPEVLKLFYESNPKTRDQIAEIFKRGIYSTKEWDSVEVPNRWTIFFGGMIFGDIGGWLGSFITWTKRFSSTHKYGKVEQVREEIREIVARVQEPGIRYLLDNFGYFLSANPRVSDIIELVSRYQLSPVQYTEILRRSIRIVDARQEGAIHSFMELMAMRSPFETEASLRAKHEIALGYTTYFVKAFSPNVAQMREYARLVSYSPESYYEVVDQFVPRTETAKDYLALLESPKPGTDVDPLKEKITTENAAHVESLIELRTTSTKEAIGILETVSDRGFSMRIRRSMIEKSIDINEFEAFVSENADRVNRSRDVEKMEAESILDRAIDPAIKALFFENFDQYVRLCRSYREADPFVTELMSYYDLSKTERAAVIEAMLEKVTTFEEHNLLSAHLPLFGQRELKRKVKERRRVLRRNTE